jgi:hypothetical protein
MIVVALNRSSPAYLGYRQLTHGSLPISRLMGSYRTMMSAVLNIVWRPEPFSGPVISSVEESVKSLENYNFVLFGSV